MKLLRKYGFSAAILVLLWLSDTYLSERSARQLWGALLLAGVVYTIIRMARSRRKYRYCPKCGCGTETCWHTEKIDASKKWIRIGNRWQYGGHVTQKTAIIRCPGCGWEINLGR